jgi:hypothetical protein
MKERKYEDEPALQPVPAKSKKNNCNQPHGGGLKLGTAALSTKIQVFMEKKFI